MIEGRDLSREEVQSLWTIDRSETIERVYTLENGVLVLRPGAFDLRGWPPGEAEKYTPLLEDCHDRRGWLYGLFDDGRLIAAAVLDSRFIGKRRDQLQLKFLHVSRSHRGRGLGRDLFARASAEARRRGASGLYVSATPSQHTVDFYLHLGCTVAAEPDAELLALEPDDIHFLCALA